ncbi:MAG: hypothetical protein AB7F78_12780 [Hyphomicrobiaceae bacterium]
MATHVAAENWTQSAEAAERAIADHSGPLIVDLDETLYLRNSTEDFIDTAAPGLLGRLLFVMLDILRPWLLTGGRQTRDAWRVRVAALVPFALRRWRKRAVQLAAGNTNDRLRKLSEKRTDLTVATLGFDPIVRPLVEAMQLGRHRLVASAMGSFADRRAGKLAKLSDAIGRDAIARATVVTDSLDDRDLLAQCRKPLLVKWPGARFVPAHAGVYLPIVYTHRVKRANLGFVQRSILGDDYMLWLLASVALTTGTLSSLASHAAGLLLLILSFWTIYEQGYVDNDKVAERYEANPVLTEEYHLVSVRNSVIQAWLWAAGLGIAGIAVIQQTWLPAVTTIAAWLSALLALHGVYILYNRVDKQTRVWLYAVLQMARAAAFVVVVPVSITGAIALVAHAISRWIKYFVYRASRQAWPAEIPDNVIRLVLFAMLLAPLLKAKPFDEVALLTALLLAAWFTFRAAPRLVAVLRSVRLIRSER